MSVEENKAALRRARDRWNARDPDGYLELYAPDAVIHGYPGIDPGLASIRAFYERFWSAFPHPHLAFEGMLGEGNEVAVRAIVSGVHRGDFPGIPPTGRSVRVPTITVLRFADGRCVERWSRADFLGLLRQLGALPALAAGEG